MQQHWPLLGSAFRGDAFRTHSIESFEPSLKHSGLFGRDPDSIPVSRRELVTSCALREPLTSTRRKLSTLRGTVITPFVQKRKSHLTFSDENHTLPLHPTDVLSEPPRADAPHVLYRSILNPSAPPAPVNFVQLIEFLDRLIAPPGGPLEISAQSDAHELIFIEIIRQYFIECSDHGRLLDKIRLFFLALGHHIPRLRTKFEAQLIDLERLIASHELSVADLRRQLACAEERRAHLQSVVGDMRTDLQLLAQHLDGLNRLIDAASREVFEMRSDVERLDSRIEVQHAKLVALNDELRALDEVLAQKTAATLDATDLLRRLLLDLENAHSAVSASREALIAMRTKRSRIDAEIGALRAALEESNRYMQTLDAEVQVDLMVASKGGSAVADARRRRQDEGAAALRPIQYLFQPPAAPGERTAVRIPPAGITLSTYDDFALLKEQLLENASLFQLSPEELRRAETGDFAVGGADAGEEERAEAENLDFLRLFASRTVSDIVDRAVRQRATEQAGTQTLTRVFAARRADQPGLIAAARGNPFLMLIPADYSQRPPRSLLWMSKNIQMIYDEKWQSDRVAIERRGGFVPFHLFVFQMALRSHPLEFLAYQFCWDLHITGTFYREGSLEAEMFMTALNEDITVEQLAFMLKCRDTIMKVGVVVGMRSADQVEIVPAYFLNQDQLRSALQQWWVHRYKQGILQHCLEFAVAPPAMHLDSTKRYVAMSDVLAVAVMEFADDTLAQMHELLLKSRIVPRFTQQRFCGFIRSMIPYATDQDCDKFYRATVSKATAIERTDISQKVFCQRFAAGSILYAHEDTEPDQRLLALLAVARDEWGSAQGRLVAIRKYFEGVLETQPENNGLRGLLGDALRYETMLQHSLTIHNSMEACGNYFQLLFALDMLFSMIPYIDVNSGESSLASLECCIKEYWLDSVFERKTDE